MVWGRACAASTALRKGGDEPDEPAPRRCVAASKRQARGVDGDMRWTIARRPALDPVNACLPIPTNPHRTRGLVNVDGAQSPPAEARKPGPRPCDRSRACRRRRRGSPSVEPRRRRARIQPAHGSQVLARVVQDVDERVTHFAWCSQQARVVAIAPNVSVPTDDAVDRLCQSDRETLDSAREPRAGIRLDEEMQVIALHAVVQDAEAWCPERGERATDCGHRWVVAQGGEPRRRTKGDVRGAATVVSLASSVRYGTASRRHRPTSTAATATPGTEWKLELLKTPAHLNTAYITS
jgi:hypothetical protein